MGSATEWIVMREVATNELRINKIAKGYRPPSDSAFTWGGPYQSQRHAARALDIQDPALFSQLYPLSLPSPGDAIKQANAALAKFKKAITPHTLGIWDSKPTLDTNAGPFEVVVGKKTLAFVQGNDHAHNSGSPISFEEARANARLTAAAPELLGALHAIVTAWETVPENVQVPEEINVDWLWAHAKSAIAKATGK